MRLAIALGVALVLQNASSRVDGSPAATREMRYERTLTLPASASGMACAVLDKDAFAHAASRSGDDFRVFRSDAEVADIETPFTLGENGARPDEIATVPVSSAKVQNGLLSFDLAMPQRPYTTVELQLSAKDYVGIATVEGVPAGGGARTPMGQFAIFDLSSQKMGSSTALPLQESSFPSLHIELRLWNLTRDVFVGISPAMVRGASVPPSREAQTIYTSVAETSTFAQVQRQTVAMLHVPAHVPVERVMFALNDGPERGFGDNFLRHVTITARPDGIADPARFETVEGTISMAHLPLPTEAQPEGAIFRSLTMEAVLAATLRTGATIEVAVDNGSETPLPIKAVRLEMRQRTVCFEAQPGNTYMLRYGDVALHAPVYIASVMSQTRAAAGEAKPIVAVLGPERLNAAYQAPNEARSYGERHPEFWWIALIVAVAAFGATALHGVKHQARKG